MSLSAEEKVVIPQCYKKHKDRDSYGNAISLNQGKSINELAALCNADPNCKAFNSNGWLIHTVKPEEEWTHVDPVRKFSLFVKESDCDPNKKPIKWVMIAVIVFILLIVLGIAGYFMSRGSKNSENSEYIVPDEENPIN